MTPKVIFDPIVRPLVTKEPIKCRLCDDLATQIWHVPGGCVCATDPVQALCSQHAVTMEPLVRAAQIFRLEAEESTDSKLATLGAEVRELRGALCELLRLYDWRNKLGTIERDFNHDRKQMTTWLNQYGREKKAAWIVARAAINEAPEKEKGQHIPTDECGFDRNASLSEDAYVCTCGWNARNQGNEAPVEKEKPE